MSKIVLDTYAWIEYFRGSPEGEKVREYVEGGEKVFTPSIVVAELHDKYVRTDIRQNWDIRKNFLKLSSRIVKLDFKTAEKAGSLKWELRENHPEVGLADALILSHTIEKDASLLTGVKHLTHREEVEDISST